MLYSVLILMLLATLVANHDTALPRMTQALAQFRTAHPWVSRNLHELAVTLGWLIVDGATTHALLPLSGNGTHSMLPALVALVHLAVRRALGRAG